VLNNRIDAFDGKKWYEARVIEVQKKKIKIHYKGFHTKYDE